MSTMRGKQQEHIDALYIARGSHEVRTMLALLNLRFEECKTTLVGVTPSEFLQAQGRAQAYEELIRVLTRPTLKELTTAKE